MAETPVCQRSLGPLRPPSAHHATNVGVCTTFMCLVVVLLCFVVWACTTACRELTASCLLCPQVEEELEKICNELLEVLEKYLVPEDKSTEGQVFYLKMAGDYYRYLAEFAAEDDRKGKVRLAWWRCHAAHAPRCYGVARLLCSAHRPPPTLTLSSAHARRLRRPRRSTRLPPRLPRTCPPPTPSAWAWP